MKQTIQKAKKTKEEKEAEARSKAYAMIGRHGGNSTFKKHGKKYMSEIGKRGAEKRWTNQKKSK